MATSGMDGTRIKTSAVLREYRHGLRDTAHIITPCRFIGYLLISSQSIAAKMLVFVVLAAASSVIS